jgi:hypothetical protein
MGGWDASTEESHHEHPRVRAGRGPTGHGRASREPGAEEGCQGRSPASPSWTWTSTGLEEQTPQRLVAPATDKRTRAGGVHGSAVNWDTFQLGFWHPFGPYTGLTVAQIIEWKRQEIQRHGWTFWSFAYAPSVDAWLKLLTNSCSSVYALCSESPGARDPHPGACQALATHFRPVGTRSWQPMPDPAVMKVTMYVVGVFRTTSVAEQVTLPARCRAHAALRFSRFRRASVSRLIRARRSRIAPWRPS